MTYLHHDKLVTLLNENNVYENTLELYKEASLDKSVDASIVIATTVCGEAFHIEITYPFQDDPFIRFKELDIALPDECDLIEFEASESCMFEIDSSLENVDEKIILFVSQILDILYGKPNEKLHWQVHNDSNKFYDIKLHDKFSYALISIQSKIFCDREFCSELKSVSDSKEFQELLSLQTKIHKIDRKKNKDNVCNKVFYRQKSKQKLPLLKAYF